MSEQQNNQDDALRRAVKSYDMDGEKITFENPVNVEKAEALKAKRRAARNPLGAIRCFNCGPFSGRR